MRLFISAIAVLAATIAAGPAYADCINPAGVEGEIVYNQTHKTAQFCDGTEWWAMKAANAGLRNDCANDEVLKWDGDSWECAAIGGGGGSSVWVQNGSDIYYNAGNVGIGTETPGERLDIFSATGNAKAAVTTADPEAGGEFRAYNSAGTSIAVGVNGPDSDYFWGVLRQGDPIIATSGNLGICAGGSTGHISFGTGEFIPERMRITASGDVGIGTASPLANLAVANDFHIAANSAAWNGSAGKGIFMRYSTNSGQDEAYIQSIDRSSATRYPLYFQGSKFGFIDGYVGIGTTNPVTHLDIFRPSEAGIGELARFTSYAEYGRLSVVNTAGNIMGLDVSDHEGGASKNFAVSIGGTGAFYINTSRNVGIGTTSPGQKLTVAGTIESTSGGVKFPDGTTQTTAAAGGGGVLPGTWCGFAIRATMSASLCSGTSGYTNIFPCNGTNVTSSCPSGYTQRAITTGTGCGGEFPDCYSCMRTCSKN